MKHLTIRELEAGLDEIRRSPKDEGALRLIVRRPRVGAREVLEEAELNCAEGLVGDCWKTRRSPLTADGSPHPEMQLGVMNSRVIALLAQDKDRWQLAGDQLFIDMDLRVDNVPPGTRLALGSAVIEVTAQPHTNCQKFAAHFGQDAMKFVNSPAGKRLQVRGINAKVIRPGVIRVGDTVMKTVPKPIGVLMAKKVAAVARLVVPFALVALSVGIEGRQAPSGSVSTGFATADIRPGSPTLRCTNPAAPKVQPDVFPPNIGTVTSSDGQRWTVPAPIEEGPVAVDLYNDCTGTGDNADYAKQLTTVVIDNDGVEITGFIFGDNYYELWVNGKFVARDPVPMTPFNSTVVRFKARYPMTYAVKAVDWETRVGLGMEYASFNIGDGGFIAYFSDGNGTHGDWRAEAFYIAPLDNPACVRTAGGRDSSFCAQAGRPQCADKDPKSCQALHFPVASDWTAPRFNDSAWPRAITWPAEAVTNSPAYARYTKFFGDAEFIWTRNLKLDNVVLARYTAKGPRQK